ncbi:uncharacterized protein LOC132706469 [Cylas formicarius]|uniref:uncharacterized protein LOC132706469 n=1 Tax=Cylas formicarius TaxID=197179 RepID=UPI002958CAA5|nr:uncharacterized protein LOC132706469 [Cylas formicarius]
MKTALILIVAAAAYVSASPQASGSVHIQLNADPTPSSPPDFSAVIGKSLSDHISAKLAIFKQFHRLKVGLIRFMVSIYTTENLQFLRTLIEFGVKAGNLALVWIPTSADFSFQWLVPIFTQFLNLSIGASATTDTSDEFKYDEATPDVTFNLGINTQSSTADPDIDERISKRESDIVVAPEHDELNFSDSDAVLKDYEERISNLDRLINAMRSA